MNKVQKTARRNLILIVPGLCAIIVLWLIDLGVFSFCLLVILMSIINSQNYYERKSNKNIVTFDERDELIARKATVITYRLLWYVYGCACLLAWVLTGTEGKISIYWLLTAFFGASIIHNLVFSISILVQYGRGAKGEKL